MTIYYQITVKSEDPELPALTILDQINQLDCVKGAELQHICEGCQATDKPLELYHAVFSALHLHLWLCNECYNQLPHVQGGMRELNTNLHVCGCGG